MSKKTETKFKPIKMCEDPELEVSIWINAKNQPVPPCEIHQLGFDIKAYSSDCVRVDLRGKEDFPGGTWTTAGDLLAFIDGLTKIYEKINDLPLFDDLGADVVWKKGE